MTAHTYTTFKAIEKAVEAAPADMKDDPAYLWYLFGKWYDIFLDFTVGGNLHDSKAHLYNKVEKIFGGRFGVNLTTNFNNINLCGTKLNVLTLNVHV